MSVVKINAITVPNGRGADLEARFAARAREVDGLEGFEGFELLRPVDGENPLLRVHQVEVGGGLPAVVSSREFRRGHQASDAGTDSRPVGVTSELLSFEVVELAT